MATSFGDALVNPDYASGGIQWHRYGIMCEVTIAVNISMPESWKEIKIATDLPRSRFGSGMKGMLQSQDTGLAYTILINSDGELIVRPDVNPHSGWYRGAIVYICW